MPFACVRVRKHHVNVNENVNSIEWMCAKYKYFRAKCKKKYTRVKKKIMRAVNEQAKYSTSTVL